MFSFRIFALLALLTYQASAQDFAPLKPYGAAPSPQQLAWHRLQYYSFVHFNMNTFTDKEWGEGRESPQTFNPTALDCRQWARICKAAGMKGIILTAKHHDGFCLWPTAFSEHSVKNSPWRDGKGDVLRELADACKAEGLKFGVYLSPWDRNHPSYGTPEYNEVFKNTLAEVLTNYGDVFEVWFDGANGEGPNGKKQVYDWPGFVGVVRKHQPNAVIFSDAGPDIRWIGNEKGHAWATNWATLNRDKFYPGYPKTDEFKAGNEDGTHWVPGEVDVSIRPGWYYHAGEDGKVKTPDSLLRIWHASVGQGSNLLLNIPVDRRGQIHPADSASLMGFKTLRDSAFARNLALNQIAKPTTSRPGAGAAHLLDGKPDTYWSTLPGVRTASIELELGDDFKEFTTVVLQEGIQFGQRVKAFNVEVFDSEKDKFVEIARGTTIGPQRILKFPRQRAYLMRINIQSSKDSPVLTEIAVY